jgi:hypothetical protein
MNVNYNRFFSPDCKALHSHFSNTMVHSLEFEQFDTVFHIECRKEIKEDAEKCCQ